MEILWQDLRYGIRMLLKKPGFTLTAIITLALGIGANTAIFSVVNAVLLRPLQYPDSERLLTLRSNLSYLNLEDFKSQSTLFEEAGGVTSQALDLTGEGEPIQVNTALVTAGIFRAFGARAAIGRTISLEEDR